ncbi:PREDICTED: high affinity copper uptake protein 1-like isoform X2 [Branchiostoma belcheri]|uniref:Copper transport protein n=1 Tax=Branchiostoma belcheri TaxID=7741 RepID=A0A6P4XRT5_BRABE|nr:PREDICTED: high affinity copper uptake protein 1-like isoform X2 [Branchiostoma belcheri]
MAQHFLLVLLLPLIVSNTAHGTTTEAPTPSPAPMHTGHTMQHTMDHTGTHQPGMHHTGTHQPGMHHTGTHQPGMHHTGMDHTGTHQPGMHHTGMDHTGTHHGMGTHHPGMHHTGTHHPGMHHTGTHHHMGTHHPGMDHTGAHGDHSSTGHGSGHNTYFYFGHHEVVVLFLEWTINTVPALIGSCIGVFAIAMLYEGLKVWREMLIVRAADSSKAARSNSYSLNNITNGKSTSKLDVDIVPRAAEPSTRHQICNCMHALQSLLHIVQVLISYGLMLVFMTFNVWLCLSVALGAGAGYFAFGWRRPITVDRNEHCH